jgi:nucleotide-binding universal stress UspA family protein
MAMKILCGVDGSADSFEAVRFVSRLLDPNNAQMALYYTPPKAAGPTGQALAQTVFGECRGCLPEGLAQSVHTIVGTERPQHGTIGAAETWGAHLIVVGARGVGPVQRLLLGSVSTTVSQQAKVGVLVVRRAANNPPVEAPRVLVAYDGSEASRHAARLLDRLVWPEGTIGRVMSVCESGLGELPEWLKERTRDAETEAMSQNWVREHEVEKQTLHHELTAFSHKLPRPFRTDPLVVDGDPANEILKAIDSERADLVVMGARGMGTLERLFLGSTSQKVLHHAPCSVLIVRDGD